MITEPDLRKVVFSKDDIGIMLLESITQGLYHDPLNSIREYVQNEFDSSADNIEITTSGEKISIIGNGNGMSKQELHDARKLGFSDKNPSYNVGFRGIGIWSGVAICNEILIRTKRENDKIEWILKIDAEGLRSDMLQSRIPLIDALSNRVFSGESTKCELRTKHGTSVELRGILPQYRNLLDMNSLISFVRQILPVSIDPGYTFSDEIERRLKADVHDYRTIKIKVNEKAVYRPPLVGIDSYPPIFETLKNADNQLIGFAWYSICPKRIGDEESRYPILKKKGFTIGNRERSNLVRFESDKESIARMTGEIHILDDQLYPTAERNELETNTNYIEFENCLKKSLDDMVRRTRIFDANRSVENRLNDCIEVKDRFDKTKGALERFEILLEGRRFEYLLEKDLSNPRVKEDMIPKIKMVKKSLNKDLKYMYKNLDIFGKNNQDTQLTTPKEPSTETSKRRGKKRQKAIKIPPIEKYKSKLDEVITLDDKSMKIIAASQRAVARLRNMRKKDATNEAYMDLLIEELRKG